MTNDQLKPILQALREDIATGEWPRPDGWFRLALWNPMEALGFHPDSSIRPVYMAIMAANVEQGLGGPSASALWALAEGPSASREGLLAAVDRAIEAVG